MKFVCTIIGVVLASLSTQALADPQALAVHIPPVCESMPNREGHFWDFDDWCRWMEDFEDNRDWVEVVKERMGK